jgi:hypothetical protein
MVLNRPDGAFGGVGPMIMGGCQLVLDVAGLEELPDFRWAFIIQSVEAGSAATPGQCVMHLGYDGLEYLCCLILVCPDEYVVAIVIIGN